MRSFVVALGIAAGVGAQSLASCPLLPITTVQVQPVFYSEVIPYNTVIDPFRNGTQLTISVAPSTVVVSAFLTTTLLPGSTTSSTATQTSVVSSSLSTSTTGSSLTTAAPSFTTSANSTTTYSTVPISTATVCIVATTSGQEQEQIAAAINEWRSDVVFVNSFLESANSNASFNEIRLTVEQVYERAFDEPCQFGTLQNAATLGGLGNDTQYLCAKNNLASIFQTGVLDNLYAIIQDPSLLTVRAHDINVARCCQVLPDVNILFRKANGIFPGAQPQPTAVNAPYPTTCQTIDCSVDPNTSHCT